ncbi:MAG: DEAD/DEAH box helicase family protein, partial [Selenomonadaceae bacterium]|nr:DEAD/DEAH box helicase family protein [Selenomonadaceae bacterium]
MQLKKYQNAVIADLTHFLELLGETKNSEKAYSRFWQEKGVNVGFSGMKSYQNTLPGVPSVCMKVPTGGGKTFLACNAIKQIFEALPATKTKVVVWLVPSDAILTQTMAALRNPDHAYRQKLDTDFGSAVEIYSKEQLLNGQNFNPTVTMEQVCICVLSYDSFRGRKENLKARQENSNLTSFTEVFGVPETRIVDADESALLQVLNSLNPLVIIDESHHAKSKLSIQMLKDFNPCFVLELTATPKDG